MEAALVIKGFNRIEDDQASLVPRFETAPIDEFQFEGSKIRAGILAAAIGVEDELGAGAGDEFEPCSKPPG